MSKSNAAEAETSNVTNLSNSKELKQLIIQSAKDMVEIDAQRKTLNGDAADIRQVLKDRGVDRDAFKDAYGYFKKRRHEREGYDEYYKVCWDALNDADTGDLFAVAAG